MLPVTHIHIHIHTQQSMHYIYLPCTLSILAPCLSLFPRGMLVTGHDLLASDQS